MCWKKDRKSALRRIFFTYVTMRDLSKLRNGIVSQLENVRMIRDQANEAGARLSDRDKKDLVARIVAELKPDGQAIHRTQVDQQAKVKDCKKTVRNSKKNDGEGLLAALTQAGISEEDDKKLVKLYEEEQRKDSQAKAVEQKAGAAEKKPAKPKNTAETDILIVDDTNGNRSIMAQTYLELVRAWSANSGSRWLFRRLDSAGWKLDSNFRRGHGKLAADNGSLTDSGKPCYKSAINALVADPKYFQTDDEPNKREAILERVKQHKRRGIRADDFTRFNYILCFDSTCHKKLNLLAKLAQKARPSKKNKAKITLLDKCEHKKGHPEEIVKPLIDSLSKFLTNKVTFAWTRPSKFIAAGPSRTCFLTTTKKSSRYAILGTNGTNKKQIEEDTKCEIQMYKQNDEIGWVIAITGLKANVVNAKKKVEEDMAKVM